MKILTIVPARKNSTRIKNKNQVIIGSKNIFIRTMDSILRNPVLEYTVVTSDDNFILNMKSLYKECFFIKRKKKLALKNSSIIDVILDVLNFDDIKKQNFDTIMLLQITSPFRTAKFIKKAIKLFQNEKLTSLATVKRYKNSKFILETNKNGFFKSFIANKKEDFFIPDGQIFIININYFLKKKSFYTNKTYCLQSNNKYESIDLDYNEDLDYARYLNSKFSL